MAKVSVPIEFITEVVFGAAPNPVEIRNAFYDLELGVMVFEVEGEDVPESNQVRAVMTVERNRAGDKFRRMSFEIMQ